MGPSEDLPNTRTNQEGWRNRPQRRARTRRCLLKGCNRFYRPDHPLERYCSEACRHEAQKWRHWKAQQKYRATARGRAKRNGQCRRRRKRRKALSKAAEPGARVIPIRFFRPELRSAWLLRKVPENPALSPAAILLARMPARAGACSGAGTALEGTGSGARARVDERCTEPIAASTAHPQIVPTYCQSCSGSLSSLLPTRRGRGSGDTLVGALRSLFFFFMFSLGREHAALGRRRRP